jgi:hypothetical protein
LSYFTLYPPSVSGGQTTTFNYVYLTAAAGPSGEPVAVTSSNPAVAAVANWVVPAGATSGTFAIQTFPVTVRTTVQITVTAGAVTQSANLTVTPPDLSYFTLYPTSMTGGQRSTYNYVFLTGPAPANGAVVIVRSSNPQVASVPRSFTIPAGETFATFQIVTSPVSAPVSVTISVTAGRVAKALTLTVTPPDLLYFTLYPSSISGGQTSAVNYVYLTGAAGPAGVPVTVTSSNPAIAAVSSFTIPAGASSGSFAIATSAVTAPVLVQISVTAGAVTQTNFLTVSP